MTRLLAFAAETADPNVYVLALALHPLARAPKKKDTG